MNSQGRIDCHIPFFFFLSTHLCCWKYSTYFSQFITDMASPWTLSFVTPYSSSYHIPVYSVYVWVAPLFFHKARDWEVLVILLEQMLIPVSMERSVVTARPGNKCLGKELSFDTFPLRFIGFIGFWFFYIATHHMWPRFEYPKAIERL